MSSLKVTLCASAAAAAAVLIPTAYAVGDDSGDGGRTGSVSVTPSTPSPGADVMLKVSGCGGKTATAASAAFVADARLVGAGGTLFGETRVRSSANAGTYDVRITCVDFQVKGRIEVVARLESDSDAESESGTGPRQPSVPIVPASPVAPVHAGGGGTARLAVGGSADSAGSTSAVASAGSADSVDEARADGPGTAQTVTGLVLAGVAATVVVYRGARRSRGTG
ncbi:hypothetical protein [Streptomyces sp. NPDC002588]|uniref:hypothetical protein n=1 Tax=Streptomyces sp. NPDC002588 TaxID=3154419 RepID=UPI00332A491F